MSDFSVLNVGDKAMIIGFKKGHRACRQKLLSMGLTPQTEFLFVRKAPLGDPVELKVRGCLFSLRKTEAALLNIEQIHEY